MRRPASLLRAPMLALGLAALLTSAILVAPRTAEKPTWVSGAKRAAFEPTACADEDGRLWALWISSNRAVETSARIDGVCMIRGGVVAEVAIEDAGLFPAAPQVTAWNNGVYVVWEAGGDGERQLFGRELGLGLASDSVVVGELEVLPTGENAPLVPQLVTREDSLYLVYQGLNGTGYDLFGMSRESAGWSKSHALTSSDVDEWNPRLAVDGANDLHLAWDFFDGASFDVAYSRIEADQLVDPVIVAGGAEYQGYPELSVDSDGAAWLAWESADQFGEHGGLRAERALGLAKLTRSENEAGVRATTAEYLEHETLSTQIDQRAFARPLLTETGLLLSYLAPVRADRKRDHLFTSWMTSLVEFGADGPRERRIPMTDGGSDPDSVLVEDVHGGKWLIFAADRRRDNFNKVTAWSDSIERRPRVAVLQLNVETGSPKLSESVTLESKPALSKSTANEPAKSAVYFGDLHRHTHLSRCSGSKDGTLLDTYRYARGPGNLDFVAITDHFQHMKPWSWYRSKRDAIRYHAPGSLVVLSGVERVRAKRGHYNDIYCDPAEVPFDIDGWMRPPARSAPAPPEHVISIPHMMAVDDGTGFDWDEFNEDRTRLFEIYQGKRGSYEGKGLPYEADDGVEEEVALARGFERGAHFGLVAASDHVSSSTSFAGLHATELTRDAIFDALRERRCFAATVARPLDASLGSLRMGEAGDHGAEGIFAVQLEGDSANGVAYVELVKNGFTEQRAAGTGDLESWIVSLRRVPLTSRGEMTVVIEGGRVESASPRRPGSPGIQILSRDDRSVRFRRTDFILIDLGLSVRWDSNAEAQSLIFKAGDVEIRLPRAELELGRSRLLVESGLRVQTWRQGASLAVEDGEVRFKLDAKVGDSYYARVAWTDGNLAWTSPIRIRPDGEQE